MAKGRPVTGLLLSFFFILTTLTASETARSAYERGREEEASQNYEEAYVAYKAAYSLQPSNIEYRSAATRLHFLQRPQRYIEECSYVMLANRKRPCCNSKLRTKLIPLVPSQVSKSKARRKQKRNYASLDQLIQPAKKTPLMRNSMRLRVP